MSRTKETGIKPSQYIKEYGFKSIRELSEITGVGSQTLIDWYENDKKFRLLNIVMRGALFERNHHEGV